ncbi:MAG: oligosaccharide flippase family protein [FCB group bacterium]|nr:oligosaccharide flippase family protein [FCB group bacterium]
MRELKKSFWDLITASGATVLSVPLMILSESIQARYLGPGNYGKVALILSAISLLYLFGLSWIRVSFIRFGKEEFIKKGHIRKTTTNFFVNNLFAFIIVSIIFFIYREPVFAFLEIEHNRAFWIILFGCFLQLLKQFIFEALIVIRLIKIQVLLRQIASKIFILFGLSLFVLQILKINIIYVIYIFLLSDLLLILIGFIFIKTRYIFPLSFDKIMLKQMLIYSAPLFFSAWSSYIITWVDTYVIKYFMTMEDVGIYQAAYKILNSIKSFWGLGLVTVTTPIIMIFKTNNETNKIKDFYLKRLLPQVSFFGLIIISLILVFSDIMFRIVYGVEFNDSIVPFKILVASQNFAIISSMMTAIILSYDMTKTIAIMGILTGIFNVIADIILVQYFGINGPAISSCIVFSINPIIWFFIIHKKFGVKRKLALLFPVVSVLVMFSNIVIHHFIIRLFFTFVIIIITYVVARRFNLFNRKDITLLNNVQIPEIIKKSYVKLLEYSDKK